MKGSGFIDFSSVNNIVEKITLGTAPPRMSPFQNKIISSESQLHQKIETLNKMKYSPIPKTKYLGFLQSHSRTMYQKWKENIEIEALKTKTIRTGLVDKGKKSLPMIPSIFHKFGPWPPGWPGPARAALQMQKQRGNIEIEALETKTI